MTSFTESKLKAPLLSPSLGSESEISNAHVQQEPGSFPLPASSTQAPLPVQQKKKTALTKAVLSSLSISTEDSDDMQLQPIPAPTLENTLTSLRPKSYLAVHEHSPRDTGKLLLSSSANKTVENLMGGIDSLYHVNDATDTGEKAFLHESPFHANAIGSTSSTLSLQKKEGAQLPITHTRDVLHQNEITDMPGIPGASTILNVMQMQKGCAVPLTTNSTTASAHSLPLLSAKAVLENEDVSAPMPPLRAKQSSQEELAEKETLPQQNSDAPSSETQDKVTTEAPVKRGRGRPRKIVSETATTDAPVKRRRGRPSREEAAKMRAENEQQWLTNCSSETLILELLQRIDAEKCSRREQLCLIDGVLERFYTGYFLAIHQICDNPNNKSVIMNALEDIITNYRNIFEANSRYFFAICQHVAPKALVWMLEYPIYRERFLLLRKAKANYLPSNSRKQALLQDDDTIIETAQDCLERLHTVVLESQGPNLNSIYELLFHLEFLSPENPQVQALLQRFPKLKLPSKSSLRKHTDSLRSYIANEDMLIRKSLVKFLSNYRRLRLLFGKSFKQVNVAHMDLAKDWIQLDTFNQRCLILSIGTALELRSAHPDQMGFVYTQQDIDPKYAVIFDGVEIRVKKEVFATAALSTNTSAHVSGVLSSMTATPQKESNDFELFYITL